MSKKPIVGYDRTLWVEGSKVDLTPFSFDELLMPDKNGIIKYAIFTKPEQSNYASTVSLQDAFWTAEMRRIQQEYYRSMPQPQYFLHSEEPKMTEEQWKTSNDPRRMLDWITFPQFCQKPWYPTERKLRLWADEVRHQFYHCHLIRNGSWSGWESDGCLNSRLRDEERTAITASKGWASEISMRQFKADLLRHMMGNPYKSLNSKKCERCDGCGSYHDGPGGGQRSLVSCDECSRRGWNSTEIPQWSDTIKRLAQTIYNGEDISFALYDALLEMGYVELAEHFNDTEPCASCSGEGCSSNIGYMDDSAKRCDGSGRRKKSNHHPRGCHVLDYLLGLE